MKKLVSSLAAAAAILAACQKNEIPESQPQGGEPFSIEASIVSSKTSLEVSSDGYKVTWDEGDALSVSAEYQDASVRTYKFTKDEGNTFTCLNVENPADIVSMEVHYPYADASAVSIGSAPDGAQTQTGTGSAAHIDGPLYGYSEISGDVAPEVLMNHVSALFEINITNPSDNPVDITRIVVANSEDKPMTGTFDVGAQGLTAKEASASAVLNVSEGTIAAGQTGKFYLSSAPFSLSQGASLTVTVTADGAGCSVVKTMPKDMNFSAGTVNHINNVSASAPEEMQFAVTFAAADIAGYDSGWKDGDAVSIFDGILNSRFEYASGVFNGSALPSGSYGALYPYDEDAVMINGAVRTEIPVEQSGDFCRLVSFGCSEGGEIAMKNVTGILKFTLDEDNVTKVTITAGDGQILAGAVDIAWNGGAPSVTAVPGGASSSVTVGDGNAVLEKGDYYVNVLPANLSEYTLTFTYKEDKSSYSGYFDKWYPDDTKADASGRQTITRGVCELPLARTSAANPTAGTQVDLGGMSATLVFYDDEVKTTINGVGMTDGSWDKPMPDVKSTDGPYSGSNCIKWTMTSKYGEVYFQTWGDDEYARGALDLTPYRNAHFTLEFAYKAEQGTDFYVRFMEHQSGHENFRMMADISEYSTGNWETVRIPLDEMIMSDYVWKLKTGERYTVAVDDYTFDAEGYPFRWDKILRLIFTFNIDVADESMKGKTVYIDDIKIKKVILSDQTAE